MKKIIRFVVAMIISFIPCAIGLAFTPRGGSDIWYNTINKSVLTPDGWVFAVAWGVLYFLLGIALFLVMNNERTRQSKTKAYSLFFSQMVLNALWSYLFFGLHLVGAAFIVLFVLIAMSIWMMRAFYPISKSAARLIWPYIIWCAFALYLNGTILFLN